MTRHSNTLVFGTNTSFGLTAGTSAANVPSVSVGYQRQEAVVMPLVANVKDVGGVLQPCDISPAIAVGDGGADTPPCMLVGRRDKSLDTYSVLGSFGATFGASGAKGEAQGGLAQYFATGLAAQLLATRGGAALVATGEAAEASAAAEPSGALQQLLIDPDRVAAAETAAGQSRTLRTDVVLYLGGLSDADFPTKLAALDAQAGANGAILAACKGVSRADCMTRLSAGAGLDFIAPVTLAAALAKVKG